MFTTEDFLDVSFQTHDLSSSGQSLEFKTDSKTMKPYLECTFSKFGTPHIYSFIRKDANSYRNVEDIPAYRDANAESRFFKEVEALHLLSSKSKNLVQFKGWTKRDQNYFMITESTLDFISLLSMFKSKEFPFSSREIVEICSQVARVLALFHESKFIYRNLNLENILYDPVKKEIKICNLDRVKKINEGFSKSSSGTPSVVNTHEPFLAPEILKFLRGDEVSDEYGCATDIYAFGVLISCFLSRQIDPFQEYRSVVGKMKQNFKDLVIDGVIKPFVKMETYFDNFSLSCLHLLSVWCVSSKVGDRPKMSQLYAICNSLTLITSDVADTMKFDERSVLDIEATYKWFRVADDLQRNVGLKAYGMGLCGKVLGRYDLERKTDFGLNCKIYELVGAPYFKTK